MIPKPKGTGGRNFNIRLHMGLNTGEEDNKQWYREILVSGTLFSDARLYKAKVRYWCDKCLDTRVSKQHQEQRKIVLVEMNVSIPEKLLHY
jgi:hypothetical protein